MLQYMTRLNKGPIFAIIAFLASGCACKEWRAVEVEAGSWYRLFICESLIKSGEVNKENAYLTAIEMLDTDQFYGIKYNCPSGFIVERRSVRFDGGGMFSVDAKCSNRDRLD